MKILAISDTHGSDFIHKVTDCDILLIAGDISPVALDHSFYTQQQWFCNTFIEQLQECKQFAKHIVFIGGNHDTYLCEMNISNSNNVISKLLPDNVHYLCDSLVEIEGIKIYGTPWCVLPKWGRKGPPVWNFALPDALLTGVYCEMPNDIDILLTHGPAFGYCDVILDQGVVESNRAIWNTEPERLGSKSLMQRIVNGVNAKYVISGHIHSANHKYEIYKKDINLPGVKFACASILDESYKFDDAIKSLNISWGDNV